MLQQLLLMLVEAVFGFFTMMLLARFLMQWTRAPFRNPLGRMVVAVTDGVVRPLRRIIPGLFGLDLPSLLLAWLCQLMFLAFAFGIAGAIVSVTPQAVGVLALMAWLETFRLALYIVVAAVVVTAALSWIAPYSPVAPLFAALAQPFLAPLQRRMKPVGGVDLSPLVLLLALQMLLAVIGWGRATLGAFLASV
jgi:YggT family protein